MEDNYFDVDDDALCVKSGRDWDGRHFGRPARDILFRNNVIGRGHGITVGSETSGSVFNVTFDNITMAQTGTGIRMKTERGRGGVVDGVIYQNINMMDIAGQCIQVTLNYHDNLSFFCRFFFTVFFMDHSPRCLWSCASGLVPRSEFLAWCLGH